MTMTELCAELRNYFDRNKPKYFGTFEIRNGSLGLMGGIELLNGQYFRIIGSVFNDGVHQYGTKEVVVSGNTVVQPIEELVDETFQGAVWAMAVPPAVIALMGEINEWETKYGDTVLKPYSSETIEGVYNYVKASGGSRTSSDAPIITSVDMFASKLNRWRKI